MVRTMKRAYQPPHAEGLCDWCFWPLNGDAVAFNQGFGHSTCVGFMHELLTTGAEDAEGLPWPEKLTLETPTTEYFRRLGREAARLGLDVKKLALAAERAAR
jgi:hypothetical protein